MALMAEVFRGGGSWMYVILAVALTGWPLALLGVLCVVSKKANYAIGVGVVVAMLGLATAGIGIVGYAAGMAEMEQALEIATPENRELLREQGEKYASYVLNFGLGASSVPLLFGLLTLGGGITLRRRLPR